MSPPAVLQIASTGKRVGVSGVVSLLARRLVSRGFRVNVVCLNGGPLVEDLNGIGIPAFEVRATLPFDPEAVLRMRALIAEQRWDLVHTHGQRAMFVGNLAARLEQVPAIVTSFHEMAAVKSLTSRWHRLYALGEGLLARTCCDACVATSRSVAQDALTVRGVPREQLVTIHNAVDHGRFHRIDHPAAIEEFRARLGLDSGDRVIGCLGSLVPVKGHRYLIEALPRIRERIPSARLVIGGEGDLRAQLERLAVQLGVANDVILPGVITEPNLFYNTIDLLALPSLSESCPMVVLEAAACEVPVVATSVGGLPDLVKADESGLLVPPADPAALAGAILRVLEDPGLAACLTNTAEAFVDSHYSAERLADRHAELYRRLVTRRRH